MIQRTWRKSGRWLWRVMSPDVSPAAARHELRELGLELREWWRYIKSDGDGSVPRPGTAHEKPYSWWGPGGVSGIFAGYGAVPELPQQSKLGELLRELEQLASKDVGGPLGVLGVRLKLRVYGELETAGPNATLACYRIVQESLTNARKYATGSTVEVEVVREGTLGMPGELRATVTNGIGVLEALGVSDEQLAEVRGDPAAGAALAREVGGGGGGALGGAGAGAGAALGDSGDLGEGEESEGEGVEGVEGVEFGGVSGGLTVNGVSEEDIAEALMVAAEYAVLRGEGMSGGFGVVGMHERTELLDGTFESGPLEGGGWRNVLVLPLNEEGEAEGEDPLTKLGFTPLRPNRL